MKVSDTQLHFQWQVLNCLIATVRLRNFLTLTFLHGKGTGLDSFPAETANPGDRRQTHTHARWQALPWPARMNLTSRLRLSLGCNSVRIVSTDPANSLCHHLKITYSLGIAKTDGSAEKWERDVEGEKRDK